LNKIIKLVVATRKNYVIFLQIELAQEYYQVSQTVSASETLARELGPLGKDIEPQSEVFDCVGRRSNLFAQRNTPNKRDRPAAGVEADDSCNEMAIPNFRLEAQTSYRRTERLCFPR
jgi:hypothetical protein